jgi:hypothetical protein
MILNVIYITNSKNCKFTPFSNKLYINKLINDNFWIGFRLEVFHIPSDKQFLLISSTNFCRKM